MPKKGTGPDPRGGRDAGGDVSAREPVRVIVWERLPGGFVRQTKLELPEHAGCDGSAGFAWGIEWQAHFAAENKFAEGNRRLMVYQAAKRKDEDR